MTLGTVLRLGVAPAPTVTVRSVRTAHESGPALTDLLTVARRDNPRRQVLFVSTVLGKHLAVDPGVPVLAGMAVGELVDQCLGGRPRTTAGHLLAETVRSDRRVTADDLGTPAAGEPCIVLGFAETATGLTHAVRRALGIGPIGHTTRVGTGEPLLTVTESHSHAVDHTVHHDDVDFLADDAPVVIVDDEFTTGATALDMILGIQRRWPRRRYVLASLIDWRSDARRQEMADAVAAVGARLDSVSLVDADIEIGHAPVLGVPPEGRHRQPGDDESMPVAAPPIDTTSVDIGPPTARRGWTSAHQSSVEGRIVSAAAVLASRRHGDTALVLGLEELMYVPMLLGVHLGPGVRTCSTTRSPIVPAHTTGYPIRDRVKFPVTNGDADGTRFLHNLADQRYDDVFVVADDPLPRPDHELFGHLARLSDHLHLVALA